LVELLPLLALLVALLLVAGCQVLLILMLK
jgi:hypothetical protein